jgi:hypothetical protein
MSILARKTPSKPRKAIEGGKKAKEATMMIFGL